MRSPKYEEIIRIKKESICIAYQQGKLFRRFKEQEKFKVHKTTMIFKINLIKLIDKHPKLMKSSVTLGFLKTYFKDIKEIRGENLKTLNM